MQDAGGERNATCVVQRATGALSDLRRKPMGGLRRPRKSENQGGLQNAVIGTWKRRAV